MHNTISVIVLYMITIHRHEGTQQNNSNATTENKLLDIDTYSGQVKLNYDM